MVVTEHSTSKDIIYFYNRNLNTGVHSCTTMLKLPTMFFPRNLNGEVHIAS